MEYFEYFKYLKLACTSDAIAKRKLPMAMASLKLSRPSSTLKFVLFFFFTATKFGIAPKFQKEARKEQP
ncbi:MAG: hypothetical protein B7C24_08570 [Bacteroidetes bacterium 4572_77]|nr:MAG: hypothetical protein B7C24_08570 [Bacteroidetes bacterium 4572_77]